MKVLLSFNEAYAPHAASVITGLIRHSSQKISIVVLYVDIKKETIKKFVDYYAKDLISFDFIKVELSSELEKRLKSIRTPMNLKGKIEPWLRLFAATYVQDDYVVWLDCDIIVMGDICMMLDEVDNHFFISACKEYDPRYKLKGLSELGQDVLSEDWKKCLVADAHFYRLYSYYHIPYNVPYLCDGIMYMNLKKWREENFESKLIERIYESDYFFAVDQDVLNSVLKGQFGVLSPKWNVMDNLQKCLTDYPSELLIEVEEHPCIIHMAGSAKPWNTNCDGRYRMLYWEYRMDTPWPSKPNWKYRLKNKYKTVYYAARLLYWMKRPFKKSVQTKSILEKSVIEKY